MLNAAAVFVYVALVRKSLWHYKKIFEQFRCDFGCSVKTAACCISIEADFLLVGHSI